MGGARYKAITVIQTFGIQYLTVFPRYEEREALVSSSDCSVVGRSSCWKNILVLIFYSKETSTPRMGQHYQ